MEGLKKDLQNEKDKVMACGEKEVLIADLKSERDLLLTRLQQMEADKYELLLKIE